MKAGYGRSRRLRLGGDFRRVFRLGPRVDGAGFRLVGRPNGLAEDRMGLAVSRAVGSAVVRNRVKRLVREAFRRYDRRLGGVDLVVVARPALGGWSQQEVDREFGRAVERLVKRIGAAELGSPPRSRGH